MNDKLKIYHERLEQYRERRLSKTERAADLIGKWCGSWSFLIIHLLGFGLWLILRLDTILLTLIVSFEAIILMNILLMSQNRQAKKDELRDEADYQADKQAAEAIEELKRMIKK